MNEIVKIDPKEFGLDETKVATIEKAFAGKIAERDGYITQYDQIIKKELCEETEVEAKELRLKLVKVRTGIAEIHKTQKSFFLAAGRFVDAWKNKETVPVTQMEETLMEIEKHTENEQKKKIEALELKRRAEVAEFSEVVPESLGLMLDNVYDAYLSGLKLAHESRIEEAKKAEKLRIETERIQKLETERRMKTSRLVEYIENYDSIEFGKMLEANFNGLCQKAIQKRTEKEAAIEAQRIENDRLKKEAEAKELAIEKERKAAALKQEKQRKEAEAKIEKERKEKEAIQKELDDEKERVRLEKEAAIEKEKTEALAPEKVKLQKAITDLSFVVDVKSKEAISIKTEIESKFEAFKKWALTQTETL